MSIATGTSGPPIPSSYHLHLRHRFKSTACNFLPACSVEIPSDLAEARFVWSPSERSALAFASCAIESGHSDVCARLVSEAKLTLSEVKFELSIQCWSRLRFGQNIITIRALLAKPVARWQRLSTSSCWPPGRTLPRPLLRQLTTYLHWFWCFTLCSSSICTKRRLTGKRMVFHSSL